MSDALLMAATRILPATSERVDRLAIEIGKHRPGEKVRRADALRAAIERGVEALEQELGVENSMSATKGAKPPRKAKS